MAQDHVLVARACGWSGRGDRAAHLVAGGRHRGLRAARSVSRRRAAGRTARGRRAGVELVRARAWIARSAAPHGLAGSHPARRRHDARRAAESGTALAPRSRSACAVGALDRLSHSPRRRRHRMGRYGQPRWALATPHGVRVPGARGWSPGEALSSLPASVRLALRQVPVPLWPLLPIGALVSWRTRPALTAALLASAAALVLLVTVYRAQGREVYLIPAAFIGAVFVACGLVDLSSRVSSRERTRGVGARAGRRRSPGGDAHRLDAG